MMVVDRSEKTYFESPLVFQDLGVLLCFQRFQKNSSCLSLEVPEFSSFGPYSFRESEEIASDDIVHLPLQIKKRPVHVVRLALLPPQPLTPPRIQLTISITCNSFSQQLSNFHLTSAFAAP